MINSNKCNIFYSIFFHSIEIIVIVIRDVRCKLENFLLVFRPQGFNGKQYE